MNIIKVKMNTEYIKSDTSRWIRIVGTIFGLISILIFSVYIFHALYTGQFMEKILSCFIFLVLTITIIWSYSKTLYYSITATNRGLETKNITGENKLLLWENIKGIRKPRFGFPVNYTYVVSRDGEKLLLLKNKKNYEKLIRYIKENAQNLEKGNT